MQREYEEFKVRINGLVAKATKVPDEGWIMQDGTPWPGNNTRDHPGMIQVYFLFISIYFNPKPNMKENFNSQYCNFKLIRKRYSYIFQVFLGHSGGLDSNGNELPRLVYVSREKRPGFQHHKKAGAMNSLVSILS